MRDAALPAWTLLRRAGENLAEEGETLVSERLGQHSGIVLDQVERQPVFPGVERGRGDQRGLAGEGGRLPDDKARLLCSRPAPRKYSAQSRPGALAAKSACFQVLLALWMSSIVREADVFFRDGVFQLDDALGARVRCP